MLSSTPFDDKNYSLKKVGCTQTISDDITCESASNVFIAATANPLM